ncbi:SRPBCC family protein [Halomicrococcus sp. NG-SE-24]|uniref:SRPBCC family protein n=1 Tax=Halomicrococcus sp. NG-SE-24 TaxID=3436928 RepID=UPI003D98FE68
MVTFAYKRSPNHRITMGTIRVERHVQATVSDVWESIADVEAVSEFAPNVSRAIALDPRGSGMHRRCWDYNDNQWDEECILWESERRYAFAVDTKASESSVHRLFDQFVGIFEVDDRTDGVILVAEFNLQPRYGPIGALLFRWMQPRMRREIEKMIENWAREIEKQTPPPSFSHEQK